MRSKPLLPALLLVGAGLSPLAQASSDDSCYPDWSLVGGGVCDTLPFLAPAQQQRGMGLGKVACEAGQNAVLGKGEGRRGRRGRNHVSSP